MPKRICTMVVIPSSFHTQIITERCANRAITRCGDGSGSTFYKISFLACFWQTKKTTRFRLDLEIYKTCLFPFLVNMKLSFFQRQIIMVACMSEKKITRKKFNLRIHRNVKFFMWGLWICLRERTELVCWLGWVTLVERFCCGLFGAAVCHVSIKMMVMIKNELQNDSWKIMCI